MYTGFVGLLWHYVKATEGVCYGICHITYLEILRAMKGQTTADVYKPAIL